MTQGYSAHFTYSTPLEDDVEFIITGCSISPGIKGTWDYPAEPPEADFESVYAAGDPTKTCIFKSNAYPTNWLTAFNDACLEHILSLAEEDDQDQDPPEKDYD